MSDAIPEVDRIPGTRVGVLGQPILDRYIYGVTHRISREAPVLIVREESEALALGGAGNTAANLAGLGARVWLAGPLGSDSEGDTVLRLCRESGIHGGALVQNEGTVTVTKTRILAGGLHTTRQQMLRIDREPDTPPTDISRDAIRRAGASILDWVSAILVSDYGDREWVEVWRSLVGLARARGLRVVVDSRHGLLDFEGVNAITPNEPEAEVALGTRIRTMEEAARAATELTKRLDLEATLLTRGREGMVLAVRNREAVHIPAVGGDAVDVTGAGDTVAATFTAAWAAGLDLNAAARLANRAASVVVQRTGTCAITLDDLVSDCGRGLP